MPASTMTPLDLEQIRSHLGAQAPVFALQLKSECESTNSALMTSPPPDDGRAHVLVCENQTHGRGRRGRDWLSWGAASLTFSVLWRFPPGAPAPAGLSLVVGLALARTLEKLGADGVKLKWPNDVVAGEGKLAGILVELAPGRERALAAVIGVGINMELPAGTTVPGGLPVSDIAGLLPQPPDRNRLLALVLLELAALLDTYASAGFPALRGAWEQRNAHANQSVSVSGEGAPIDGVCAGVDEDGALLLETPQGRRRLLSGEVSLRPKP